MGIGSTSGGSGTGNSLENSDTGDGDDDPKSSNDGSGYDGNHDGNHDGNRTNLSKRDTSRTDPVSFNSGGSSPKRRTSINQLISKPSGAVVRRGRAMQKPQIRILNGGPRGSSEGIIMRNGNLHESERPKDVGSDVATTDLETCNSYSQSEQPKAMFHQSMYLQADNKPQVVNGLVPERQEHYHKSRVPLHVNHDLQRCNQSHLKYSAVTDVRSKRPRSLGDDEQQNGYVRELKSQRLRHVEEAKSVQTPYQGNDNAQRAMTNGSSRR